MCVRKFARPGIQILCGWDEAGNVVVIAGEPFLVLLFTPLKAEYFFSTLSLILEKTRLVG